MNKSNWKDTAELIALASIVFSLILVAYELRQNTMMMRAQTRDSMTEKQMTLNAWMATNEYTANVAVQGSLGELQLGTPESLSFRQLLTGITREWENSFYQYEQGLFEQAEYEARRQAWSGYMSIPPIRAFWENNKANYSPNFRAELDQLIVEIEARNTSK